MRELWKLWTAAMIGLCLATLPLASAAAAQAAPAAAPENSPSDLAREGLESMLRALRLLVESIPQYELPEVLDNGDIIIRRKRDGDAAQEDPEIHDAATRPAPRLPPRGGGADGRAERRLGARRKGDRRG